MGEKVSEPFPVPCLIIPRPQSCTSSPPFHFHLWAVLVDLFYRLACTSFFDTSSKSASVSLESSPSFHPQLTALSPFPSPAEQSCLSQAGSSIWNASPTPFHPLRRSPSVKALWVWRRVRLPQPQSLTCTPFHITWHRPAPDHTSHCFTFAQPVFC